MEEGVLSCSENQPHSFSLCLRCRSRSAGSLCMCSLGRHSDSGRQASDGSIKTSGEVVQNFWVFKYIILYSSVFLLFLLGLGNSIHYSELVCIDCYEEFSLFVPSDQISVLLHPALCPRRWAFILDINQLPCPVASGCVQPKGATTPSSWSFRPGDETRPPVLPHFLLVPLTLPTSLSIIPS